MAVCVCGPTIQEAEAGGCDLKARLDYKNRKQNKTSPRGTIKKSIGRYVSRSWDPGKEALRQDIGMVV